MVDIEFEDRRDSRFQHQDLRGAQFVRDRMAGAVFRDVGLQRVRMRGVELTDAEIDGDIDGLTIWGVEVAPLLVAELDRRHPERSALRARTPDELRAGYEALVTMWDTTIARARTLPPGTVDLSVDGEWSFTETIRHLVLATDAWLNLAILRRPQPFHPLGLLFWQAQGLEGRYGLVPLGTPVTLDDALAARADRVAQVRAYLAGLTQEELDRDAGHDPWGDGGADEPTVTVRQCLGVIFEEEWQHHRYATRDLAALATRG